LLIDISKFINKDKNKLKNNPPTVKNIEPVLPIHLPIIRAVKLDKKDKKIINKYIYG
jgi:hypothetical protein